MNAIAPCAANREHRLDHPSNMTTLALAPT